MYYDLHMRFDFQSWLAVKKAVGSAVTRALLAGQRYTYVQSVFLVQELRSLHLSHPPSEVPAEEWRQSLGR